MEYDEDTAFSGEQGGDNNSESVHDIEWDFGFLAEIEALSRDNSLTDCVFSGTTRRIWGSTANGHDPDGLEPWEDRSDICKLTLSILQTMPGKLEKLIEMINHEESNKITHMIVDGTMGWAVRVAMKVGIRCAVFWPASAATLASILCIPKLIDDRIIDENGMPLSKQIIQLSNNMPPIKPEKLMWACLKDVNAEKSRLQIATRHCRAYRVTTWLYATQLLSSSKQHLAFIYIAFGSFTMFNQTQFEELAHGLELSNKPFLWVVRPGMTVESTTAYPDVSFTACNLVEELKDEAGIISRVEIKDKVQQLLNDKRFKDKALAIKESVTSSVQKGGHSHQNLDSFIKWIREEDIDAKVQHDSKEHDFKRNQ
ncbi:hypothetical protein E3N88_41568 [Mikania micrantha]|uniref:UDP-glycosyltransferases domain-containing protein n=1 Tax=Mikania micrantha TaxID=192012 RepID=A0A5N6LK88_9ASTR|nr:hypothetical protein E3N88_41568 [Mikania micrantha]